MQITPTNIKRIEGVGLEITWSSGATHILKNEELRRSCPCASCNAARGDTSHSKPLSPQKSLLKVVEHTAEESLKLTKVWAVGNYAIGILWGDGHDSGIFSYEHLLKLSAVQ